MHIGTGMYEGKEIKESQDGSPFSARSLTIKEEIFTVIGTRVNEATVLDINDTCGMYGIEALTRDAAVCLFVNPVKEQASLVKQNLRIIGVDPGDLVINDTIKGFCANPTIGEFVTEKYDVIFFEVLEKDELEVITKVAEKLKHSGVMAIIYPNKEGFSLPTDLDGGGIVETREFDDKKVAIILKVSL